MPLEEAFCEAADSPIITQAPVNPSALECDSTGGASVS